MPQIIRLPGKSKPACVPVPRPVRVNLDWSHQQQFTAELDYARELDDWLANDADWCLPQGERSRRRRELGGIIGRLRTILRRLSRPLRVHRRAPAIWSGPTDRDLIRWRPFFDAGTASRTTTTPLAGGAEAGGRGHIVSFSRRSSNPKL
jgi:hypothetical protein